MEIEPCIACMTAAEENPDAGYDISVAVFLDEQLCEECYDAARFDPYVDQGVRRSVF